MPVTFPGLPLSNETPFWGQRIEEEFEEQIAWFCLVKDQKKKKKKKRKIAEGEKAQKKGIFVYFSVPVSDVLFVKFWRHNELEFVTSVLSVLSSRCVKMTLPHLRDYAEPSKHGMKLVATFTQKQHLITTSESQDRWRKKQL